MNCIHEERHQGYTGIDLNILVCLHKVNNRYRLEELKRESANQI